MYVSSVGVVLNYLIPFYLYIDPTSEIRDKNVVPSTVGSKNARIHPCLIFYPVRKNDYRKRTVAQGKTNVPFIFHVIHTGEIPVIVDNFCAHLLQL